MSERVTPDPIVDKMLANRAAHPEHDRACVHCGDTFKSVDGHQCRTHYEPPAGAERRTEPLTMTVTRDDGRDVQFTRDADGFWFSGGYSLNTWSEMLLNEIASLRARAVLPAEGAGTGNPRFSEELQALSFAEQSDPPSWPPTVKDLTDRERDDLLEIMDLATRHDDSLVRKVARFAVDLTNENDSLSRRVAALEAEKEILTGAIRWALGEEGDFGDEPEPMKVNGREIRRRYYWRSTLREMAFPAALEEEKGTAANE